MVAGALLLAVAAPVYGVPAVHDRSASPLGILVGSVAFVGLGVLLGTVLPSARAAQAVGLLLFFPSFLLGVGGPPPAVMSPALRDVADSLPLDLATDAIRAALARHRQRRPGTMAVVGGLAVVAAALAARRTAL